MCGASVLYSWRVFFFDQTFSLLVVMKRKKFAFCQLQVFFRLLPYLEWLMFAIRKHKPPYAVEMPTVPYGKSNCLIILDRKYEGRIT